MKKKKRTLSEKYNIDIWQECQRRNISYYVVYQRLKTGHSLEKALSTPVRRQGQFNYKGKTGTLIDLIKFFKWDESFICNRIYVNKIGLEEAVLEWNKKLEKKTLLGAKVEKKIFRPEKAISPFEISEDEFMNLTALISVLEMELEQRKIEKMVLIKELNLLKLNRFRSFKELEVQTEKVLFRKKEDLISLKKNIQHLKRMLRLGGFS